MADITPPVSLTSFTAAGIAEGGPSSTGFIAAKLALPAFLLPYAFIYSPEILLQTQEIIPAILAVLFFCLGITALASASLGWIFGPLNFALRTAAAAGGLLYSIPSLTAQFAGVLLFSAFAFRSFFLQRLVKTTAAGRNS
ncbi:MAG: hypothetical protein PHD35_09045 [Synergistaceae bacterium]|nr:hypothetical protein [Synergistaceae bacterium]